MRICSIDKLKKTNDLVTSCFQLIKKLEDLRKNSNSSRQLDETNDEVFTRFEWLANDGAWIPYSKEQQAIIKNNITNSMTQFTLIASNLLSESINLNTMKQIDSKGVTRAIRKVSSQLSIPFNLHNEGVFIVDQNVQNFLLSTAIEALKTSCPQISILKVEFNMCKNLWKLYTLLRGEIRKNCPHFQELFLWHSTSRNNAASICKSGFDRSFNHVHQSPYGIGNYFATTARAALNYTAINQYQFAQQALIYTRVSLGKLQKGKKEQPYIPGPGFFYSMVDDLKKPSIYVTTKDNHEYPEIVFTVKEESLLI